MKDLKRHRKLTQKGVFRTIDLKRLQLRLNYFLEPGRRFRTENMSHKGRQKDLEN